MSEAQGTAGAGRRASRRAGPTVRLSPSWQLPETHLVPEAVVAFVDGELSLGAHERASEHLLSCTSCAADVDAQRQARAAVHACAGPKVPAALLASLHSIPDTTELSTMPDNLAVDTHGQLVAVQRPDHADASFGSRAPLGSSAPLGSAGLGPARRSSRRAVQGAGVVMSGLVLSALALALGVEGDGQSPNRTGQGVRPSQLTGGAQLAPTSTQVQAPTLLRLGVPQR